MNTQTQAVKKDENFKNSPMMKKVETPVTEKKAIIEVVVEKLKATAEERIARIQLFEAHSKRFNLLKEKANDLKMFDAGNDKTSAKIYLENSAGFKFEVRNSNVIEKVTKTMREELNALLSESEKEILIFEI